MKTSSKTIKIAFVGVSGAGKTTSGKIVAKIIKKDFPNYKVAKLNVALPLHRGQAYLYHSFGLPSKGQDGKLLQFLALHFEEHLGQTFDRNLHKILAKRRGQKLVIVNTDCRNNAYRYLKRAGFIFIRVQTGTRTIAARLGERGDVSRANSRHAVEQINLIRPHFVVENNGSLPDLRKELEILVGRILRVISES